MDAVFIAVAALSLCAALALWIGARFRIAALRRQMRRQGALLSGAAQQLRAPLNDVLGLAQTLHLRAEEFPPENRELIQLVAGSGALAKSILLDVFDILDYESGRIQIKKRVELLGNVIESARHSVNAAARKADVNVEYTLRNSAKAWLLFDDMRVRQCVVALLRQAISQSPGGRVNVVVEVSAHPKRKKKRIIVVTVRDTSPGLRQAEADKYFSAHGFTRVKHLMEGGVSPLSLIVARILARIMGGDVTAASAPGKGVTFKLRVPAGFVRGAEDAESASELAPADIAATVIRRKTVLVVDDNDVNYRVSDAFLKKLKPARVLAARNGREAIDTLCREKCDLVLMDTQMPVMDGLTATREIREHGGPWRDIPIIAVSAASSGSEREAAFKAGVSAFLAKPVGAEDLYEAIAKVCID